MKIKDLIKALEALSPELEIYYKNLEHGPTEIDNIGIVRPSEQYSATLDEFLDANLDYFTKVNGKMSIDEWEEIKEKLIKEDWEYYKQKKNKSEFALINK